MDWKLRLPLYLALFTIVSSENATTTTSLSEVTEPAPPAVEDTTQKAKKKLLCHQCQCMSGKHLSLMVFCNGMEFSQMPEIRHEIRSKWVLEMDGNLLKEIEVFPYYENLTKLTYRFNQISIIADSAFANLTNLQHLDLSHNNITTATLNSETFKGNYHKSLPYPLESLKMLNLSNNHLKGLPEKVFLHLTNLTMLDLSHNPFMDFSFKTAATFTELISMETLDLSYTQLKRLPDHFFAELHNLKTLDLSGNNFLVIPPEVNYVHGLEILKFNDNIFGIIGNNSFWVEMNGLKELHLCRSKTLFKIDEGAFGNLTGLKSLYLNSNPQFSMIHPRAFVSGNNYTINLENIYLQNNALTTLSSEALNWQAVNEVDLQGNPWSCDCHFEWFVRTFVPSMVHTHTELTRNIVCDEPPSVKGLHVVDRRVLSMEFVCISHKSTTSQHSFILIATIVVGCLLLATGLIFFIYIIFKKANSNDWIGENVKYRRAQSDENVSTIMY